MLSSSRPSREPAALLLAVAALRILVAVASAGHVTAACIPSPVGAPRMASVLISAGGEATGDRALAVHGRVLLVASSRDLLLACGQWEGSEGDRDREVGR